MNQSHRFLDTPGGAVPVLDGSLSVRDVLGACKVRWGIGRKGYAVSPGLYALGSPDETSPVMVSANYRLTVDRFRRETKGLSAWLLLLDTKGVNVWCAAGKGTFGTEELIHRIRSVRLNSLIQHREVILPQLSAPGVGAHTVKKETGFSVVYGPIRSADVIRFVERGNRATEEMRTVRFPAKDRLAVTPVELVQGLRLLLFIIPYVFLVSLLETKTVSLTFVLQMWPYVAGIFGGTVLVPLLLPYIPGRALSLKGIIFGLVLAAATFFASRQSTLESLSYFLILPAITGYLSLKFTGATTYTSLSGVQKEVRIYVPVFVTLVSVGVLIRAVGLVL